MVQLAAEKPWTAAASPSAHRPRGRFGVLPPDMLEHAKLREEFGALQHVSYASFPTSSYGSHLTKFIGNLKKLGRQRGALSEG